MRIRRWCILASVVASLALLAACQPAAPEPGAAETAVPATETPAAEEELATPTLAPTDEGEGLPPAAVLEAQAALSEALGISREEIEVVSFEQREWPNACLGLAAPDEVCAEVITPGFLVTLQAGGETYQVRSNLEATEVRIEGELRAAEAATETPEPATDQPAAVVAARQALAERLSIEPESVEVVSFEGREWRDACLGLATADEMCAQVITPGYLVTLRAQGGIYEAHTDRNGSAVRFAGNGRPVGEGPAGREAVVMLQRSGGIQGDVVEWRLYADGQVEKVTGPPGADQTVESTMLADPRQVQQLLAELEAAGFFELDGSYMPADPCCDRFQYTLSASLDGESNTIETVESTEDVPAAVWESIELVESTLTSVSPPEATQ